MADGRFARDGTAAGCAGERRQRFVKTENPSILA